MHARAPRLIPDALLGVPPALEALNAKPIGSPPVMTAELIASSRGKRWCLSNARAGAELGWVPRIPLKISLRDTLTTLRTLRAAEAKSEPHVIPVGLNAAVLAPSSKQGAR
jgi:hypothetical protein